MKSFWFILYFLCIGAPLALAQSTANAVEGAEMGNAIFDDEALLDGYAEKYADESKEVLLAMLTDDSLGAYKTTAAIRVFREKFADQTLSREKPVVVKALLRRLNHTDSAFVQIEVMHTLVVLDRYQYFESMINALILKMNHYNRVVSANAYDALDSITKKSARMREAKLIFKTLRKTLFLSRKRLENIEEPDEALRQKLALLRWSIKVLGTQELKRLPPEVIRLL